MLKLLASYLNTNSKSRNVMSNGLLSAILQGRWQMLTTRPYRAFLNEIRRGLDHPEASRRTFERLQLRLWPRHYAKSSSSRFLVTGSRGSAPWVIKTFNDAESTWEDFGQHVKPEKYAHVTYGRKSRFKYTLFINSRT